MHDSHLEMDMENIYHFSKQFAVKNGLVEIIRRAKEWKDCKVE